MIIKAIIVEDIEMHSNHLKKIINDNLSDIIYVCNVATSVEEGAEIIRKDKPDLVFLDIKLPDGIGFDLIEKFRGENFDFHVIFTTHYDEYAIRAINMGDCDYLLKPIDPDKLFLTINKYIAAPTEKKTGFDLITDYYRNNGKITKWELKDLKWNNPFEVQIAKIIYCKYDRQKKHCIFYLYNHNFIEGYKRIGLTDAFEYLVKDYPFFQTERDTFINLALIKHQTIDPSFKKRGYNFKMINGESINVSRDRTVDFIKAYSSFKSVGFNPYIFINRKRMSIQSLFAH